VGPNMAVQRTIAARHKISTAFIASLLRRPE
jgi:hypothetical protein